MNLCLYFVSLFPNIDAYQETLSLSHSCILPVPDCKKKGKQGVKSRVQQNQESKQVFQ